MENLRKEIMNSNEYEYITERSDVMTYTSHNHEPYNIVLCEKDNLVQLTKPIKDDVNCPEHEVFWEFNGDIPNLETIETKMRDEAKNIRNEDYKKEYLKDLLRANLKDSYEKHWAFITMYAEPGEIRACPSCQGKMYLDDGGDWEQWFCDNCDRVEYLVTIQNEKPIDTPYWYIDCCENTEKPKGIKYWD